jgi:glucose-1-phosphate thymidylyltransferase
MTNAIILAAGYSTRLHPLTDHIAKPLLTVGPKTIIDWALKRVLKVQNLGRIRVVVNAKFCSQFEAWRDQLSPEATGGRTIDLLNDGTLSNETRLGAEGDVCLALETLGFDEDVVTIAGDNLFEADLQALVDLRRQQNASVLGAHEFPSLEDVRERFGVVTLDPSGRVLEF